MTGMDGRSINRAGQTGLRCKERAPGAEKPENPGGGAGVEGGAGVAGLVWSRSASRWDSRAPFAALQGSPLSSAKLMELSLQRERLGSSFHSGLFPHLWENASWKGIALSSEPGGNLLLQSWLGEDAPSAHVEKELLGSKMFLPR